MDGRDVLPGLLADDDALASFEEGQLFGGSWLRTLGAIPNEYLYYYYFTQDAIASIIDAPATRGEFLLQQQETFYGSRRRRIRGGALGGGPQGTGSDVHGREPGRIRCRWSGTPTTSTAVATTRSPWR